jgi:hypothetical protein
MSINRPLKPWRTSGGSWRGGRVVAINGSTVTIRVRAEQAYVHNYDVNIAAFAPGHAPSLNGAVVVHIGNAGLQTAIADYLITEVRGAQFCGAIDSTDEQENFGHVPYALTGESPYWDWIPAEERPPRPLL